MKLLSRLPDREKFFADITDPLALLDSMGLQ